jgi:arginyl-tRNA--protein-N-Asp/Glu arginylyltransferase
MEQLKDLKDIYEGGYLPYTGSSDLENYFYFCRSLRVNLKKFTLNSENRRILKKHKTYERRVYDGFKDMSKKLREEIFAMYLNYFKKIHGEKIMSEERLTYVLHTKYQNKNILYYDEDQLMGGMIMVEDKEKDNIHVWYIGYKEELKHTGFGIWMFLDMMQFAKDGKYKHFYVGTAYGDKAKYKLNFEGLEYFDGNTWLSDVKSLKNLLKNDKDKKDRDMLKQNSHLF